MAAVVLVVFDGFEALYEFSRAHEAWQLDEFLSGLILLSLFVALFAVRRASDLRSALAMRAASERRLRSIVESIPIGLHFYRLESDDRLVLTGSNPAADRILGVEEGHWVGLTVEEAFPSLTGTEVPQRYRDIAAGGATWITEQIDYADSVVEGAFSIHAFRTGQHAMAVAFEDVTARIRTAKALRTSGEGLRLLIDGVSDHAIVLLDPEGRVASWNEGARRLTGWTEAEIVGEPTSLVYSEEAVRSGEPDRLLREAVDAGSARTEGWRIRKDGSRFWANVVLSAVRDEAGRLLGFAKVTRDLTERRQEEEARRASEERFRTTFENAPIGMALVSPEGQWLRVNPALCHLLGYTEEEFYSLTFQEITHSDDLDADLEYVEKMLAGEIRTYQMEKRYRRKSGDIVRALLSVSLVRDENGDPVHFLSQIQDITDRIHAEETLRKSEEKYRATVANIPGVAYRAFPDWTTEFLGDLPGVTGYMEAELNALEGGWLSVIHPEDREMVARDGAVLFKADASVMHTYRIWTKSKEERWIEDRKTSRRSSDGHGMDIYGIVLDITERKTLENQLRQAQKMEAVGQLTGGIAHDFNNVLTVILTNAELMTDHLPLDPIVLEEMEELQAAARRGATMISRLLQFSRQAILSKQLIRPGRVIEDLSGMLQRLIPENIRFEFKDSTEATDLVSADVGGIEQVLVNLCTNARDAMPRGGDLRIECERTWLDDDYHATHPWITQGDHVVIKVADNGVGMSEETQRKLFEPFLPPNPRAGERASAWRWCTG